jgi:RNA polymerase sigma-70 factor, ECF subfamily
MSDPGGWVAAIARRETYRRFASRSGAPESAGEAIDRADSGAADLAIEDLPGRLDFEALLQSLSPLDRALIELRYVRDLSQPAVAAATGLPEGTTKVRLHRLRRRLREALELENNS